MMFALPVNCARVSSADFGSENLNAPSTFAATMSAWVERSRTIASLNVTRSCRTMATQARARATLLVNRLIPINFRLMGACLKIRMVRFAGLRQFRNHNCRLPQWRTNFLPFWQRPDFSGIRQGLLAAITDGKFASLFEMKSGSTRAAMKKKPVIGAWAGLLIAIPVIAAERLETLPQTKPLDWEESDLSSRLMDGAHRFIERQIAESVAKRSQFWARDFSSPAAYARSVQPNRARFQTNIGAVDTRLPARM